jgi:hypothetical protein
MSQGIADFRAPPSIPKFIDSLGSGDELCDWGRCLPDYAKAPSDKPLRHYCERMYATSSSVMSSSSRSMEHDTETAKLPLRLCG